MKETQRRREKEKKKRRERKGHTDAGHDVHVHDDVGGVGDLDTVLGEGGTHGAHAEGDHVHDAALHAAVVELLKSLLRGLQGGERERVCERRE